MSELSTREKLILAGMEEVRSYGMQGFSLRRVASKCGVSCAAPYKHFADKESFFLAMVDYINEKWAERLRPQLTQSGSVEKAIASCVTDYVRFLCENPPFKSVLIIKTTGIDSPRAELAGGTSVAMKRLFVMYGRKHGLDRITLRQRIFRIRSIAYGSALIISMDDSRFDGMISELNKMLLDALK